VRENVLCVPLAAVFSEPDRSKVVYIHNGEGADPEKRSVQIGVANLDFVEIESGLTENEAVMLTRPRSEKG